MTDDDRLMNDDIGDEDDDVILTTATAFDCSSWGAERTVKYATLANT